MSFLLADTILPKWLVLMPGSAVTAAIRLSAPAFVAGMLNVYVHGLASYPGSAICSVFRVPELSGRAVVHKNVLPGSVLAAIRTALGSDVKTAEG